VSTTQTRIEPKSLEIRLLGELVVLRDGRPSPLPTSKKTRALLAYLVATGRSQSRERLCELLWEVPDDPRGALRWSLSKLRPIVDTPARARIAAERERVGFEVGGADVDLLVIRALSARGLAGATLPELSAAAGRFGGAFLEGLDLPDCVQFYGWCVGEREQARALHVSVLKTLVVRTRSSPELALAHARALVALDPLAESSHLEVIRLLAAAGRTRDALDECDRCSRTLAELIGASPSAELGRLRASLRPSHGADRPSDRAPAVPVWTRPAVPGAQATVLVGRARERQVLDRLALGGTEQQERGLLLVGDSGMGKTRLLEELVGRTLAAGGRVLQGRAFEAEGVRPYGVWLEALRAVPREAVADHLRTDLALLLPELGAAALTADRPRLFDAILELLRALSASAPRLAVVLDDVQWMDEASAALLHFVARATEGEPIFLACAARPGELEDNPVALAVLRALERERRLVRLPLEPLSAGETAALARQVAPGVDAQRVHADSEGNPLFALELARALAREEVDTSATLGHLVRDRLGALGELEQAVLPWASALGRSFESSALARVSGLSPAVLVEGLEWLERHGVLRASRAGSYDFSHHVVRSAAYARMSEPRRRLVHIQIARVLWQDCADGEAAGEVLHHAALAGEQELAARASVAAGERCIRLFAYADALDLSRRGLGHAAQLPARVRLPLEVELLGLRARRPSGGALAETDEALAEAARAAEGAGLLEAAARAHYFRSLVLYGGGDLVGALASSERRVERACGTGSTTAVLHLLGSARCRALL
jgi:DNA-binding SARP family transcriptional activator